MRAHSSFVSSTTITQIESGPKQSSSKTKNKKSRMRAAIEAMENRYMLSGGVIDTSFGSAGTTQANLPGAQTANAIVIQSDGKIVQGGAVYNPPVSDDFALFRYTSSGATDTTFNSAGYVTTDFAGGYDMINSLAIQSDGKIIAGGTASINSTGEFALARYNTNGTLDTSFGTNGLVTTAAANSIAKILIQSDGKILAVGNCGDDFAVARYNTDGSLDNSFGNGGVVTTDLGAIPGTTNNTAGSAALQSDGKIVVAGGTQGQAGPEEWAFDRYNTDGSLDTSFGGSGTGKLFIQGGQNSGMLKSVAIQSDGKIVAAGTQNLTGSYKAALVRLNSDGSLDTGFAGTGEIFGNYSSNASSVAIQADGKILVGATGGLILARYNTDGSLDTTFNSSGTVQNFSVTFNTGEMAIESDGKVVVGGSQNNNVAFFAGRYTLAAPPTANAGGPYSVGAYSTTTLSGAASTEPDNGPLTYQWDLNYNGSTFNPTASGVSPTFSAAGISGPATRTVALRVVDALGMASTALSTATVTINPVPPVVSAGSNQTVVEGTNVSLTGSCSDVDPTDTYTFNWHITSSNGQSIPDATTANTSFAPSAEGNYTATFTVTDRFGSQVSSTATITSLGVPTANAGGPYSVGAYGAITLSGAGSTDPDNNSLTYHWDLNYNGSTFNPTVTGVSPTFSAVGISGPTTRTVALQVVNSAGVASTSLSTATVTIFPIPPLVSAGPNQTVNEGTAVSLTGSYSDIDPTDTFSFYWHITSSNGQSIPDATTANTSFTPLGEGAYTATFTVLDRFGSQVSSTATITSLHVAPTVTINGASTASREQSYTINFGATGPGISSGYEPLTGWTINWGDLNIDGSNDIQTFAAGTTSATHTYLNAGSWSLQAAATDKDGSSISSMPISVANGLAGDLALNRGAVAPSGTASNAVDGNSTTLWTSSNTSVSSQWLYVDLGALTLINEVKVTWGANYAATYSLRASNDSATWWDITSTLSSSGGVNDTMGLSTTARYLLIQPLSAAPGAANFQIASLEVYGGNNVAFNRPAVQSSGSSAANAVDASATTMWTSATFNGSNQHQWVFYDLGQVMNINELKLWFGNNRPATYDIQVGDDSADWSNTIVSRTTASSFDDVHLNADARYILVNFDTPISGATNYQLADFAAYGASNLATGMAATASSNQGAAANVSDSSLSTAWTSTSDPTRTSQQWVSLDLGTGYYSGIWPAYDITRVDLNWGSDYPSSFKIQSSTDQTNWQDLTSVSNFTGGFTAIAGFNGVGRYVRVLTTGYGPTNQFTLKDFDVYGMTDLAMDHPASASSYVVGNEPGWATDQSGYTSWVSAGGGAQWLQVDLGKNLNVMSVGLNWGSAYAASYVVQLSTDGVNWTNAASVTSGAAGQTSMWTIGTARYVRVYCQSTAPGQSNYQLKDLAVYGM